MRAMRRKVRTDDEQRTSEGAADAVYCDDVNLEEELWILEGSVYIWALPLLPI